jgi:hypothetical protein
VNGPGGCEPRAYLSRSSLLVTAGSRDIAACPLTTPRLFLLAAVGGAPRGDSHRPAHHKADDPFLSREARALYKRAYASLLEKINATVPLDDEEGADGEEGRERAAEGPSPGLEASQVDEDEEVDALAAQIKAIFTRQLEEAQAQQEQQGGGAHTTMTAAGLHPPGPPQDGSGGEAGEDDDDDDLALAIALSLSLESTTGPDDPLEPPPPGNP